MVRTLLQLILTIFLAVFVAGYLYSFEYSLSIVALDNFTQKIYSESETEYIIKSEVSEFALPDTPFQEVLKRYKKGNVYTLILRAGKGRGAYVPKENDYLSDTRFLDYSDPALRNVKKGFAGSGNIIGDVERFVYNRVRNKKMGIPIVPASHVLKSGTGDCTEHTVLCTAILRSLGVPARAVTGMILSREFGSYNNVFVYHMWGEAYIDGRWVLVDATRPGKKFPNRYIAFACHHLKTEMPLSYLKAISAMKNFSVEYGGTATE